jgi:hypothetical protein
MAHDKVQWQINVCTVMYLCVPKDSYGIGWELDAKDL